MKSLFKTKSIQVETPKVFPPCLFKIGDIVNIKLLEDRTKKFKVYYIFEKSNGVVVEYFYKGGTYKFCKNVEDFEFCDDSAGTIDITKSDWLMLSLFGDIYSEWSTNGTKQI